MIRIAVAGSGGLAQHIAQGISRETSYPLIILSRMPNQYLRNRDYQVMTVDYDNREELRFALIGVDTVISTVSGQSQLNLIDAAASAGVRRFAPAEFEGSPSLRPLVDPLDNGKAAAQERLRYYASGQSEYRLESTSFVCGILYERFGPNGMAYRGIGNSTGISGEGNYLMDIRNLRAQIPYVMGAEHFPYVCMTSASDLARFVVRALDLPSWPPELRMQGERMTVDEIVRTAEAMKGAYFFRQPGDTATLRHAQALASVNYPEQIRLQHLISTAEGRYDFSEPWMNSIVNFQPTSFRSWLRQVWAGQ